MSRKYKFINQHQPYFVSCSVVHWFDVFENQNHCRIIIESLKYCHIHKGLILYAWCIMPNHLHLIMGTKKEPMQGILRDFKSFTSGQIRKSLEEIKNDDAITKMINTMKEEGLKNKNNKDWQFWQQHNHPQELFSRKAAEQKLNYVHYNPVKAGLVNSPGDWLYSSARDYAGKKGLLDIEILR